MAKFPAMASLPLNNPITVEEEFKTLISEFDDLGTELRRQKRLYPRRNATVQCKTITKAQGAVLWAFYLARKGAFEAFNFFLPHSNTYTGEYVGTGDGSTVIWNLPAETATSYTLYLNAAAQTGGGVDYTFGSATGEDGADKITFVVAPNDGYRITFDFTGYLKIRSRFNDDRLSHSLFFDKLVSAGGIKLKGLLNDQ